MWILLGIMSFALLLGAVRTAERRREVRRLSRALDERDRQVADLNERLQTTLARFSAIQSRLQHLEELLGHLEDSATKGQDRLKLDSHGRLLEDF